MNVRACGILLHISSLPSKNGIGDVGTWAYRFAEYLAQLGQAYWQILPLTPTDPALGNSPYSSPSAFAGNPVFISPEMLVDAGYLNRADVPGYYQPNPRRAQYTDAWHFRRDLLRLVFSRHCANLDRDERFRAFLAENKYWLEDYALFTVSKRRFGGAVWTDWPEEFRDRRPAALDSIRNESAADLLFEKFAQFIFFRQWKQLKAHCNGLGLSIVGDMPIYVNFDSADVWANHELFKLGPKRRPEVVAGVPPDYFSKTGQRWGNPVYDWDVLRRQDYAWWLQRIGNSLKLYDILRLDHFRGFSAYWAVPAEEETAINGEWVEGPGVHFFNALMRRFPNMPIIAEDLGMIDAEVRELKNRFDFPGMVILQFCFGSNVAENPYSPHNHPINSIVYTGTHDNNTFNGWFHNEANDDDRQRFLEYAGCLGNGSDPHLTAVRLALQSVAHTAITPMQDILGLGQEARMNTPSTSAGNWEWRLLPEELDPARAEAYHRLARIYGRL